MMRTTKNWKLPVPEETEDGFDWQPVVRVGRVIPFGYKQDPEDKDVLLPIVEELNLLEKAKKYLRQYSYRDVANWLSEQSGRYISYVGLRHRVKLEEKRKREASNKRYLAERYKEALEKAEKIEASAFGTRTESSCTTET